MYACCCGCLLEQQLRVFPWVHRVIRDIRCECTIFVHRFPHACIITHTHTHPHTHTHTYTHTHVHTRIHECMHTNTSTHTHSSSFITGLGSLHICWSALFAKIFLGKRVEAFGSAPNGFLPNEMARVLAHIDHSSGGRPPLSDTRRSPAGASAGQAGASTMQLVGSVTISVLNCVRRYLRVLLPRLAGKVREHDK